MRAPKSVLRLPDTGCRAAARSFDLRCGLAGSETYCTVFSILIGTLAGLVVALRENRWRRQLVSLFAAGAIASLSAGLGCVRLGVWGVASMVAGIAAGSLLGVAIFKRPAA